MRQIQAAEIEVFLHITAGVLLEPQTIFLGCAPAHEPVLVIEFLKLAERQQLLQMRSKTDTYDDLHAAINAFANKLPDDSYKRIKAAMRKRRSRWAVGTAPKTDK